MDEGLAILGRLVSVGDRRKVTTHDMLAAQHRARPTAHTVAHTQTNQGGSVDHQIKDLARYLKRHTATRASQACRTAPCNHSTITFQPQLQEDLLQCCTQLGTKIEVYATLIGLLNVDDYNFVGGLLQLAASAYSEAWQELDAGKATALLRMLAALVPVHVLPSTSVFALLTDTIKAATDIATGTPSSSSSSPAPGHLPLATCFRLGFSRRPLWAHMAALYRCHC